MSEPSNWSVSCKRHEKNKYHGQQGCPKYKGWRLDLGFRQFLTHLANLREGSTSAPLNDSVHQFDLERLYIFVLNDGKFGFLGNPRYSSSNFLHHSQWCREFFFQFSHLLTLLNIGSANVQYRQTKHSHLLREHETAEKPCTLLGRQIVENAIKD